MKITITDQILADPEIDIDWNDFCAFVADAYADDTAHLSDDHEIKIEVGPVYSSPGPVRQIVVEGQGKRERLRRVVEAALTSEEERFNRYVGSGRAWRAAGLLHD